MSSCRRLYRPRCRQRNHRSSAYSREEDVGEASPSADRLAVFHLRSRIVPGISTWFGRLPPPSCLEMQAKPDSGRHPFSSVLVLTSDHVRVHTRPLNRDDAPELRAASMAQCCSPTIRFTSDSPTRTAADQVRILGRSWCGGGGGAPR